MLPAAAAFSLEREQIVQEWVSPRGGIHTLSLHLEFGQSSIRSRYRNVQKVEPRESSILRSLFLSGHYRVKRMLDVSVGRILPSRQGLAKARNMWQWRISGVSESWQVGDITSLGTLSLTGSFVLGGAPSPLSSIPQQCCVHRRLRH